MRFVTICYQLFCYQPMLPPKYFNQLLTPANNRFGSLKYILSFPRIDLYKASFLFAGPLSRVWLSGLILARETGDPGSIPTSAGNIKMAFPLSILTCSVVLVV